MSVVNKFLEYVMLIDAKFVENTGVLQYYKEKDGSEICVHMDKNSKRHSYHNYMEVRELFQEQFDSEECANIMLDALIKKVKEE